MNARLALRPLILSSALLAGLTVGCVIDLNGSNNDECGSTLSHSHLGNDANGDGVVDAGTEQTCFCDEGYQWQNPSAANDFDCVSMDPKGNGTCPGNNIHVSGNQCFCDVGYTWCSDDPADLSCCAEDPKTSAGTDGATGNADTGNDSTSAGTGGTADTGAVDSTGGGTGGIGPDPDPATCTTDAEGTQYCNNTSEDSVGDSTLWVCTGGQWVEMPDALTQSCTADGYDFAYGCVSNESGDSVDILCGSGPGTDCNGDATSCVDADVINYCQYGKLTADSCTRICQEDGDAMGITYENGTCSSADGTCCCYDSGNEADCGL